MNPNISIITPVKGRIDLLKETWNSVLNQVYNNWEWIIIDDGSSTDDIRIIYELAETESRIKVYLNSSYINGPSSCRNIGVKNAKGKFLMFLDSDDLITENCLGDRARFLNNHPELDFAVFTQEVFYYNQGDSGQLFNKFFNSREEYINSFLKDQPPWQTSGPLWLKESFNELAGFNLHYLSMEDPELHLRALIKGFRFEVVNDHPDFYYRVTKKGPEESDVFWKNSIKYRRVFFLDIYNLLESNKLLLKHFNSFQEGYLNYFKSFLLSRSKTYQSFYIDALQWGIKKEIFSWKQRVLLSAYYRINNSLILKNIPFIKGIIYNSL